MKRLLAARRPLRGNDPEVQDPNKEIWGLDGARLDQLLSALARSRAALLLHEYDGAEYGIVQHALGLITISDLNRQAFRALLYRMVSVLEVGLSRLIEGRSSDPWDWLKHLNEEDQVNVLGYWRLSEKRGVDINPISATNFTNLLQIVERMRSLLGQLGYSSAADFKERRARMSRLRNGIMHPVRPLILGTKDVEATHRSLGDIIELGQRVEALLAE